ncbi:esterase/lipase family protein, partial [Candidatus Hodarchaeum mangrovi]
MKIQVKGLLNKNAVLLLLLIISVYTWDSQQSKLLLELSTEENFLPDSQSIPHKRVSSCIYFVHGYGATNSQFSDMINFLNNTGFFRRYTIPLPLFFDYLEKYRIINLTEEEIHRLDGGITTYATDFYDKLVKEHSKGAQVDIIAHSLGGLIIRELLRVYRDDLEKKGIRFNRIVTLGTPHLGSILAQHPLKETIMIFTDTVWDTPIIESVKANSSFIVELNTHAIDYM